MSSTRPCFRTIELRTLKMALLVFAVICCFPFRVAVEELPPRLLESFLLWCVQNERELEAGKKPRGSAELSWNSWVKEAPLRKEKLLGRQHLFIVSFGRDLRKSGQSDTKGVLLCCFVSSRDLLRCACLCC